MNQPESTPKTPLAISMVGGPLPTFLSGDHPDIAARAMIAAGQPVRDAARDVPSSSYVWALLAEEALDSGDEVTAYAFARTGYHRGLDSLRKAGWRGQGPIPVDHEPNQGFLRALYALSEAAQIMGEDDEAARCRVFLRDSGVDPEAVARLR